MLATVHRRTLTLQLIFVQLGLIFAGASTTLAVELAPSEAAGKAILQHKCGRCHAVDLTGESPLAKAPPFRTLLAKFSVEELKMRLSEGVVSHYRDMPQIDFTSEEITGIIDYLSALGSPHQGRTPPVPIN